jgi:hypothetical protein
MTMLKARAIITSHELIKEAGNKYTRFGEAIQSKILYQVRERKNLSIIEEKTLELAESLAEASATSLDSSIASIESIQGGGEFKSEAFFLKSKPHLYSLMWHTFKLLVSVFVVTVVAAILAAAFSKPLSDFAVYMLGAIFVVFATWEFKSYKQ